MKFNVFFALLWLASPISLADTGTLASYISSDDQKIKKPDNIPILVTLFKNNKPISQHEKDLSSYISFRKLDAGEYSLRFEGEGIQTTEKHGVLVFSNKTTELNTVLKTGKDTKSITFSTKNGGYTDKTTIASKIKKLEVELSQLKKIYNALD